MSAEWMAAALSKHLTCTYVLEMKTALISLEELIHPPNTNPRPFLATPYIRHLSLLIANSWQQDTQASLHDTDRSRERALEACPM
jgi:hypothetical protein